MSKHCIIHKNFLVQNFRIIVRNLKSGGKIHPFDSYSNALGVSDKTSLKLLILILSIDWPDNVIFNISKYGCQ